MSKSQVDLWNKDNSDVLPEFQLTYGHALFRGLDLHSDWRSKLFNSLELGRPMRAESFGKLDIPLLFEQKWPVLGSSTETHFLCGRVGDVWSVFGPHDFFLQSKKWMAFNAKIGGIFALATQMAVDSFYYDLFDKGVKQTNVLATGEKLRIIADTPITAYADGEKIYEDQALSSISEADAIDLVRHDSAIHVQSNQLTMVPRFRNAETVQDSIHYSFERRTSKNHFLGIRWR
jgi:hypothetical protein